MKNADRSKFISEIPNFSYVPFFRKCLVFYWNIPLRVLPNHIYQSITKIWYSDGNGSGSSDITNHFHKLMVKNLLKKIINPFK